VYGIGSAVVIAIAVWRHGWRACLPWVAAGALVWTWVEYLAHRFVLHGIFPNGPGWWRQLLHRRFDHLHWHHHQEPWNGRHISGTLRDTGPFVAVLAALAAVAPLSTAPALVAAFLLGYVIEEWVHLSVHFAGWRGRYFRYIRRHHMYHHGARGRDLAFGLTSDAWDRVYGTQFAFRLTGVVRRAETGDDHRPLDSGFGEPPQHAHNGGTPSASVAAFGCDSPALARIRLPPPATIRTTVPAAAPRPPAGRGADLDL
jgi:sterol desaturase/sphingolipid hydroxylase (fatty acid hydroxylase superfamily)